MSSKTSSQQSGDRKGKEKPTSDESLPSVKKISRSQTSWTGFTKTSNFVYFLLTVGVFAGFSAFNFVTSLDDGHWMKPKPPGEQFWFRDGLMHMGMQVHLWSVLPAGMLLPLQFLPVMRRKYLTLHIWSGRLLFSLLFIGNITAGIIARHSFGGTITTQILVIALVSLTSFSSYKAWSSIRNLHIDQHRAWTLRTWSYACSILSLRIFMIIIAIATSKISRESYRSITTCEELIYVYGFNTNATSVDSLYTRYPACVGYDKLRMGDVYVIVNAGLHRYFPEERAALLNMIFGVSGWAAILVHVLLIEVYLNYTKAEDERLKKVSTARRRAAGFEGAVSAK